MNTVKTSELRVKPKLWDGSFFINKMKQGRDQIVSKRFVCVDVDTGLDDKESIKLAIKKLKEQL